MISDVCVPLIVCPSTVGSDIAGDAAGAVFNQIATQVGQAAEWLVREATTFALGNASPDMANVGLAKELAVMKGVALVVVLPVLLAATIGPVLRQDGRRLLRVWGVGLPVAVCSGLLVSEFTKQALEVTDYLCSIFVSGHSDSIAANLTSAMSAKALVGLPPAVQILLGLLVCIGAVMVWLELVVRSAGVYAAVFFMPLVLVAFVWPATAGMAKRGVEILVALVLSKFVIVASLSLGLAILTDSGPAAVLSGCGILLIAAFTPFVLFRMTPVVEAAAIAHMEGMSRAPFRAASSMAAGAATHPVAQMVLSAATRSGSGPETVGTVESMVPRVAEATPDFVPSSGDA